MSLDQVAKLDQNNGISAELREQILSLMAKECQLERNELALDADLDTLGIESIDVVMLLQDVEDKFNIYIPMDGPISEAKTVNDFVEALGQVIAKPSPELVA